MAAEQIAGLQLLEVHLIANGGTPGGEYRTKPIIVSATLEILPT